MVTAISDFLLKQKKKKKTKKKKKNNKKKITKYTHTQFAVYPGTSFNKH
jgi:hypothetical protein